MSAVHWTPIRIARQAANFLAPSPETRVLDIGSGPGKFCLVGALETNGSFHGIEQRGWLVDAARAVNSRARLPNLDFTHGNVLDLDFRNYDAFYVFNPFEENLEPVMRIDDAVALDAILYERYTLHVATQLSLAPLGTRLVTYHGACDEVPTGYEPVETSLDCRLKFWMKTRQGPPASCRTYPRAGKDYWGLAPHAVSFHWSE